MEAGDNNKSDPNPARGTAFSFFENLEQAGSPWEPHRKQFGRFSGAASKRGCGVSVFWPGSNSIFCLRGVLAWTQAGFPEKACRNGFCKGSNRLSVRGY